MLNVEVTPIEQNLALVVHRMLVTHVRTHTRYLCNEYNNY